MLVGFAVWSRSLGRWDRLRARAEAAGRAGDAEAAARAWSAYNGGPRADADSRIDEARAWLAAGFAARADAVLTRVNDTDPTEPEPWLLRLEILRVEDRPAEALGLGLAALATLHAPEARLAVLRGTTLALLADVPDDLARATLARWAEADPTDLDARAARLRRIAANPRPGDLDRAGRIATLSALLASQPDHAGVRRGARPGAGRNRRGRARSGTPRRLADRPARCPLLPASRSLGTRTRPPGRRVSRRLPSCPGGAAPRLADPLPARSRPAPDGRDEAARAEAETVARLRERLDPGRLGPRLDADLARITADPAARYDLADLCASLGLDRLADAWRNAGAAAQGGSRIEPGGVSPAPTGPTLLPADLPSRPRTPTIR